MILNDNEGTSWTDTNGGKHHNERSVRILLHDIHAEYTGDFGNLPQLVDGAMDTHVRVSVIWDHYAMENLASDLGELTGVTSFPDAYGEQQAEKAFSLIDPTGDLATRLDIYDTPTHLWLIEGRPKGLERAFDHLASALDVEDGVHGDDDAFDYWPNTMDMLWVFAEDLDTIKKHDLHKQYVRSIAQRVLDRTAAQSWVTNEKDQRQLMIDEWGREGQWMKGVK
jgi:hypothetical protein